MHCQHLPPTGCISHPSIASPTHRSLQPALRLHHHGLGTGNWRVALLQAASRGHLADRYGAHCRQPGAVPRGDGHGEQQRHGRQGIQRRPRYAQWLSVTQMPHRVTNTYYSEPWCHIHHSVTYVYYRITSVHHSVTYMYYRVTTLLEHRALMPLQVEMQQPFCV